MFPNRTQAGRLLAEKLKDELTNLPGEMVVLGIPRGGLVVAATLAHGLNGTLEVTVTKKIPAPDQTELALGAIGENQHSLVLNTRLVEDLNIQPEALTQAIAATQREVTRRLRQFRGDRPRLSVHNKEVILVDDGVATGATMLAAIREVRTTEPKQLIVAVPVVAKTVLPSLEAEADRVVFLEAPADFFAVGQYYESFEQVSDEEVTSLLNH